VPQTAPHRLAPQLALGIAAPGRALSEIRRLKFGKVLAWRDRG
jgi:hypothetical protein